MQGPSAGVKDMADYYQKTCDSSYTLGLVNDTRCVDCVKESHDGRGGIYISPLNISFGCASLKSNVGRIHDRSRLRKVSVGELAQSSLWRGGGGIFTAATQ